MQGIQSVSKMYSCFDFKNGCALCEVCTKHDLTNSSMQNNFKAIIIKALFNHG